MAIKDFDVSSKFNYLARTSEDEFCSETWFPNREEILKNLRLSLSLVGEGEIKVKDKYDYEGDSLMYVEKFDSDKFILVIHAKLSKEPYGSDRLYNYEICVYSNNPRKESYGYGFGNSGIHTITHTLLLGSVHNYCRNKNIVSLLCKELRSYIENYYS